MRRASIVLLLGLAACADPAVVLEGTWKIGSATGDAALYRYHYESGVLTVQLPDGKRIEGTYRVTKSKGNRIWVETIFDGKRSEQDYIVSENRHRMRYG